VARKEVEGQERFGRQGLGGNNHLWDREGWFDQSAFSSQSSFGPFSSSWLGFPRVCFGGAVFFFPSLISLAHA